MMRRLHASHRFLVSLDEPECKTRSLTLETPAILARPDDCIAPQLDTEERALIMHND